MKWISRKLFILFLSTILVFTDKVSDWIWLFTALAYIGGNLIDKLIELKRMSIENIDYNNTEVGVQE